MKQLLLPIVLLATAYCQAAPILPEEAKNHIGEDVSVRGLVEQVSISKKGHAFLNFSGRCPNHIFTGYVPAEHVSAVEERSSSDPWLIIRSPLQARSSYIRPDPRS